MSRPRGRGSLLLVLLGGVALVLVVLLGGRPGSTAGLDPDNAGPSGARALARVLQQQGVAVTVVRTAAALEDTRLGPGATVVVTSTDRLGASTTDRLQQHLAGAPVVLVEPNAALVAQVSDVDAGSHVAGERGLAAGCGRFAGLRVRVEGADEYAVQNGCFHGEQGAVLAQAAPGITFLGAGDLLANDQVLRADNAAVALRLLGAQPRLVWYVPDTADLVGSDGVGLGTLLPAWLQPGLWLAVLAALALVAWRARRLGRLATEPLPVVVKAIETTESRGRLYHRAGDRGHAAETLRRAARDRMAEHLGLPTTTAADTLVRDVAHRLGRPVAEVDALVGTAAPPPTTDKELVGLATRLSALDREVRRP